MSSLYPTKLEPGEDYATVDDILHANDLPEATLRIPGWKKNGKPLVIRVKAPSLAQRELIQRESTEKDGTTDGVAEIEATLRECVIVPKLTIHQASQLRQKNGAVLEQVARLIWTLGQLDQESIDAIVQGLAGAPPPPADGQPDT